MRCRSGLGAAASGRGDGLVGRGLGGTLSPSISQWAALLVAGALSSGRSRVCGSCCGSRRNQHGTGHKHGDEHAGQGPARARVHQGSPLLLVTMFRSRSVRPTEPGADETNPGTVWVCLDGQFPTKWPTHECVDDIYRKFTMIELTALEQLSSDGSTRIRYGINRALRSHRWWLLQGRSICVNISQTKELLAVHRSF
jgi:hypothetical protein